MIQTLLSATEFLNSGMPTSDDIRQEEITAAIVTIEQMYVKERLQENYIDLLENPTTEENKILLDGGMYGTQMIAGIKEAEKHMVCAYLLSDRFRLTRFGTDEKESEYSRKPTQDQIDYISKMHWEIGQKMIDDVCEEIGLELLNNSTSGLFNILWY